MPPGQRSGLLPVAAASPTSDTLDPPQAPSLRLHHAPCISSLTCRRPRRAPGTSQPHSQHTAAGSAADSYTDGEAEGGAAAASAELRGVLSSGDEEGRWHDAVQRALVDSLQPPRAEHPSWWGKRYHNLQVR